MSEPRVQAWETRRKKYGPRGHSGCYTRQMHLHHSFEGRLFRLIVKMHDEGALSEGQICKALGLGRIEFRRIEDDVHNSGFFT